MKHATVVILAGVGLLVGVSAARAFIGGSGTDSSTASLPGACSFTGAPCGPGFPPCPFAGPPAPETCLLPSYSSTLTQDGTSGEASHIQVGPYECKQKRTTAPKVTVNEDTLLTLVNDNLFSAPICACVLLFGGQENFFTTARLVELSLDDVDEINLCSLLPAGQPPAGGLTGKVVVLTVDGSCSSYSFTPQSGVYAWLNNVIYKGAKKTPADPFSATGTVSAAKTELRIVPSGVDGGAYAGICSGSAVVPSTSYLENTFP